MKEQYPRFSVFKKKVAQRMRDLVFGTRKKKKPHTSKNDSIDPSVFLSEMPYRGQAGASPYSGVAIRKEQKQKQTPPSLRGVFDEAIQKEQKTHLRQDSGMAKQGNFLPPLSHEDVTAPLGQGSRRKERTDGIVRIFTSLRFWKWDYARFFKTTIWCIRHPKQTWQALRVDIFRKVRDIERKLKSFIRWCFATLPRRIVASVLIALIVVLPVSNLFFVHQASAAWWNDSWLYRKSITVTNNTTAQTNVYIAFTLDTSDTTKFQNDCGDLRFTDANGNLQDYFIVSGCATANTVIHVNLQTFLSGSQSLFSYYGNPTVQNGFVNADFPTQASNYTIGTTGTEEKGPGPIAYWAFDEGTGTVAKNALNNSAGTGGTITYVNGFVIHTFTTVGNSTFVPPARVSSVEVLVVGGGGIGGANLSYTNGGGAGGGVVYHPTKAVPGGSPIPLTVGAGGSSSSFSDIVAVAGGNANVVGKNGGSTTQSNSGGGTGYGNAGGAGANATGGGGGGAGGAGSNGYSGTGGPGKAFDISGTSVYYAGGGGGCGTVYVGTGGVGGGGNCAGSASPNTGGGSGGYRTGSGGPGASGSGIVIVRYPIVSDGILTNMSSPATATSGWQTEDQCVSGKCLAFDGTDDYVNEPTSISNVQSLSFWARPATTTQSILQLSSSVSVSATGGTVSATGFTSPTIYVNGKTSSPITANTWNHIEITTGTPITADAIKFGVVNTTYFNGKIDEPKLYPYARTKAQAGQDYAAGLASADANSGTSASFGDGSDKWMSDGLVGYWKMDESSWNGTTGEVIDASGNGNNGTATGITGTSTGGNSTTTVCDTGKAWTVNALAYDTITLTSGTYSGQTRTVSSNTATCVTVSSAFGGVPSTDGYRLTPSTVGGKYGSGGSFDGTGGYIKTNQGTLQGAATFSMWVKSSKSGDQVFMSMGDSGWSNTIGIMNYGGNLAFFGSSTFTILDAVSKIVDGKWHHVVITQSASSNAIITSYIDGVFGTRVTGQSGILSVNKYNYIGNRFDNMVPTSGFIDETRIYNRALSPAEVRKLYDWAPGPVGYWKMDENTGNTVADSSGNNNNGTWTDTGSHWAVGKIGGAGKFRNSANWITVPNSPSLNIPSSNLTISAWMYTKSWGGTNRGTVLGKPGYNYYLRLDGGGNKSILYSSSATGDAAGPVYNFFTGSEQLLNVWHHVEISRGGGYGKFYVDGVLVSSTALSDMALPVNSGPLCIGALLSGGTYAFDGLLDDVKLYNYARSQEQVLQDMTGEDASSNYQSSKEATVYYKFDEGNGTTANNSGVGGSALNGTLTNMASPATSTSGWTDNGKYGKGLNFDGVNDSVNEPTSIANAQAVSFWAKPTSTTQSFLQLASGISVSATSGTVSATGFTPPAIYVNGKPNGAVTAGIWNHILVETATPISANAIKLGLVGSTYYSGALDDVKIFPYALSADDVKVEYDRGAATTMGSAGSSVTSGSSTSASAEYCPPGNTEGNCAAGQNPSPVGEWKMDEGTGTTAKDTSGNGNDGTWSGTGTHWAPGKFGSAGKFNGSSDYADVGTSTVLRPTSAFTLSSWVNISAYPGSYYNILGNSLWAHSGGYGFELSGTTFGFYAGGTASGWTRINVTGRPFVAGTWYHIVGTYDGAKMKLYINGAFVNETTLSSVSYNAGNRFAFGAYGTGGLNLFKGKLDQVRIYPYARTAAQIAWDYNRGGPTAWWKMDECQGNAVHDSSGNGNDGTLIVGSSGTQTSAGTCQMSGTAWGNGATGKFNSSLNFDGTDDYASVPTSIANAQAVSFWVKPTSTTQSFLQLANGISVSATSGTVSATGFTSPTIYVNGKPNGAVTAGIWNHILVETATPISANAIKLGLVGSTYYSGALDDVRIYNYALTKEQIANVMNNSASVAFGNSDPCGGVSSVSDADGNPYGTVAVGTQCWMASNMMTTRYPDGTAITRGPTSATWNGNDNGYYAYPPNTSNNAEETLANIKSGRLGFLYQWSAVMYGSTTPGAQGICPSGWHVPTDAEQYTLENFLKDPGQTCSASRNGDDCRDAGAKMIFGGSSGLNFPLDGFRDYNGIFFGRGGNTFFASSQKSGSTAAVARHFFGSATVNRHIDTNPYGFSVRCLKNNP